MKFIRIKKFGRTLTAVSALLSAMLSSSVQAATVDLLVLYDSYTNDYFKGDVQTAMLGWVNQMNTAYKDSQVDIQLRLVGTRLHEQAGANMNEVLTNLRVDSTAIALRDQLGADFVSQLHKTGSCGIGYFSVNKSWTWNVLSPNCGPMVMSHELGHNMGLAHSRRQGDTTGSRYRYGLGYGVDNVFSTIMAYPSAFNTSRFNRFSNPNILCRNLACGVAVGLTDEANAALALHNVRDEIAAFRPTVGTLSSSSSTARLSSSSPGSSSTSLAKSSSPSSFGNSSTANSSINIASSSRIASSSAASATPFSLTIQAENVAAYRGVAAQTTTDIGGGRNVTSIDANDWMLYDNITLPTSGTYTIEFRVASLNGGGEMAFDLFDPYTGLKVLAVIPIPKTGGSQSWVTVSEQINMNAGTYKFGLFVRTGGWNINWWRIRK
ncbi:MAG: carbohydrate-binding protein [Pseudomonadota bacterium]